MIDQLQNFKWLPSTAVAIAMMLLVSGCADDSEPAGSHLKLFFDDVPLEDWSNVPERKEPKAVAASLGHDVVFYFGEDRLSANQRTRLDAFLKRADVGDADRVHVAATAQGVDPRLAERRTETVSAFLKQRGLRLQPPPVDVSIEPMISDSVKVVVRRYLVTLPGCPDWSGRPSWTYNTMVSSNWGCATAINLGLMVADPGDLDRGRRPGPVDGAFSAGSIERYRKGETTPLSPEDIGVIETQQKGQ